MEFTSTEHTPRNLLLRAVRVAGSSPSNRLEPSSAKLLREYDDLKLELGGVTPHLEVLVAEELQQARELIQRAAEATNHGSRGL